MARAIAQHCLTVGFISLMSLLYSASSASSEQPSFKQSPRGSVVSSPEASSPATETPNSSNNLPESTAPQFSQEIPVCPPGQFASAFSDVLPDHWAYTAVNQLASAPVECFDFPQ